MGNRINHKPDWLIRFNIITMCTAILFAFFVYIIIFLLAIFPAKTNTLRDYIHIAYFGIYLIGLLIGFKWKGLGGLLCFIAYIFIVFRDFFDIHFMVYHFLIIPAVLYILSWYFHRRINTKWKKCSFPIIQSSQRLKFWYESINKKKSWKCIISASIAIIQL
jgi:hypothetical protein